MNELIFSNINPYITKQNINKKIKTLNDKKIYQ